MLVSASSDSSIRLWCLETFRCIKLIYYHTSSVLHIAFSGDTVVSCSKDATIAVWKFENSTLLFRSYLSGHRAAVNAVEFDHRYIVSASGDSTIKVWDAKTYACVNTLQDHTRGIACIHYVYPYIVSGSSDSDIK
ncbi:hypothetical protein HZS_5096 [Henneguya salminicola]|nr:hypothetical protein HZS_5096 [Henneguya salminicola]